MSEQNSKTGLIAVVVVVILALIGAGAYMTLKGKKADEIAPVTLTEAPATPEAAPEEPIVQGEVPPQPETPANEVVVETKKLDVPATPEVAPAVANPAIDKLMEARSIGSATAPIKLVEYSSLTCGHCAHFHKEILPALKTKFVDTGKVQITFREFPLNGPALDASQILRCMPEDKFVSFMDLLFAEQENWAYKTEYKDSLRQYAKLAGLSDQAFDACLANTALKERLVSDMKAAEGKYKIASTPSFVVNDGQKVIVGGQPVEFFEKTFEELASPAAPATPAEPAPAAAP